MFFSTILPLLLSTSAFALPAFPSGLQLSGCSTAGAVVDIPTSQTTISQTATPVSFVALGVGVQNYTCNDAGKFASAGALATIYDISCALKSPIFKSIPDIAMAAWSRAPANAKTPPSLPSLIPGARSPITLGQHYFIKNDAGGITPRWDFIASQKNPDAFVNVAKVAGIAAPTGAKDIDWLSLKSVAGGLATEVYRTDTRAGQPAAACTAGQTSSVKYVSFYWFNGGTVKK